MGNWSWDARISLICLIGAMAFAAGLLACTLMQKSKLVPTIGLICCLVLMAGVTLTAQMPNLMGGGIKPDPAAQTSSAASATVPAKAAQKTSSTSSMSRMAYAEARFKEGTASANAEMKRIESRFSKETTVSSSASSSTSSQASSSASSSTSNIRVLRAPGAVQRGNVAQLSIQGKGNIQYKIKVIYDSGNTGKGSEMSVQSDTFGRASWAWTVGKDIAPGAHFITITGGGETLTTSFTTT